MRSLETRVEREEGVVFCRDCGWSLVAGDEMFEGDSSPLRFAKAHATENDHSTTYRPGVVSYHFDTYAGRVSDSPQGVTFYEAIGEGADPYERVSDE